MPEIFLKSSERMNLPAQMYLKSSCIFLLLEVTDPDGGEVDGVLARADLNGLGQLVSGQDLGVHEKVQG